MKEPKHLIWAVALVIVMTSICWTVIYGLSHPFVFKIEMDNNTLEAVKQMRAVYELQDAIIKCAQCGKESLYEEEDFITTEVVI